MRKIILFIACSLDGYIARENGSVDWLFTDADYGYSKFYKSIDTMIMGRKTYEKALELGDHSYNAKKWYVFTRAPESKKDANVEFITDIVPFVRKLKEAEGKNIWLVGGSEIISLLLAANLLDELIISIHPIILGKGIPLFRKMEKQTKLKMLRTVSYKSGLVKIHYKTAKHRRTY